MVYLSRSECRNSFWHVVTYDVTDPDNWIELGAIRTEQPCGTPPTPAVTERLPTTAVGPAKPLPDTKPAPPPLPAAPASPPSVTAEIAPVSGSSLTNISKRRCRCTREEEDAEFQRMISLYTNDVHNARSLGYQAGNDPGYSDPGVGLLTPTGAHKAGNCADWAQVSWSALVTRTWKCWHVDKIRARQHWTLFGFHHFVRLTSCGGRVVFLDPWKTGNPDWWEASDFPFADGAGWSHTPTVTHNAGDSVRDPGND